MNEMLANQRTDGLEAELKFVVQAEEPERVARRIASMRRLASFVLIAGRPMLLHDKYFDTIDRAASRNGLAIRVRRERGRVLVAVKGPNDAPPDDVPSRIELESAWSRQTADELLEALAELGLQADASAPLASPEEHLASLGLRPLIARRTRRRIRHLAIDGEAQDALGEVVIDRVDDVVDALQVRHWEVEVEASSEATRPAVATAGQALLDRVGQELRPFNGSKLGIGLALRELKPRLRGRLVDSQGRLTPEGFNAVEQVLNRGSVTAA